MRRICALTLALVLALSLAACGEQTPKPAGPANTSWAQSTQPPSGTIDPALVGTWSGYFKGWSMHYDFRDDGTFSYNNGQSTGAAAGITTYNLWVGRWSKSGDIVYMTQMQHASWSGKLPDNLVWASAENDTMRIEMREPDASHSNRYFINLDIVMNDASPKIENQPLPSWLYMGDS